MTFFDPPAGAASGHDGAQGVATPIKRPSRWSVRNWPVRWKVLAIALAPMVLAIVFGGLRIAGAVNDARQLRLAADRAEMIPAVTDYMAALDHAWVAVAGGGEDARQATTDYARHKSELRARLAATDVTRDVESGVVFVLGGGQALLDKTSAHEIALDRQVTGYAPILLTAEEVISESVRVGGEGIRARTQGLSRAVGVRGQMTMQRLLVEDGDELAEPALRTSMATLAGTEPSALTGLSQLLGVGSPDATILQQQYVHRMTVIADPDTTLADNPDLLASITTTDGIADRVITDTADSVTTAVGDRATDRRNAAIRDSVLVVGAIVGALAVVLLVARLLVRPLRILRDGALQVAHADLADEIARVRGGDEREPAPLPVHTTEEVGQVAHAVDELHAQALLLAGDETRLRLLVNDMFTTMSRRNRSLVDQQLSLIDRLERNEEDPDRLESLFRLDHLATRMRRNGANLLVLAGAHPSGDRGRPAPLSTVIGAASSEVEDYRRVEITKVPEVAVTGTVTGDTVHLLAELIDNALRYSPPTAPARIAAVWTEDGGVRIDVTDTGLGMTNTDLRMANMRLRAGGEASPENARHMGLFVVGQLARRHGIRVRLRLTGEHGSGITAEVYLPPSGLSGDTASPRGPTPPPPPAAEPDAPRPDESFACGPLTGSPSVSPWWEQAGRKDSRNDGRQAVAPPPVVAQSNDDLIYQRMLSENLGDPHQLGRSRDLDWKSVWDHGWSVAADAEQVPVTVHTEAGLPVRDPGARLVPGTAASSKNRDGSDPSDRQDDTPSDTSCAGDQPRRDPEAVRASMSSHFGGVHAARSHARNQGVDQ